VQVDPSSWRTRRDSDITVGLGKVSRERRIMAHEAIMAKQQELVSQGAMGTLLMPHHLYESYSGWVEAWGFEPDLYVQDPRKLPPPPPKGPDPQQQLAEAQAQAMMMDGQSKMMRAQNEQAKLALEAQKAQADAVYRQQEQALKAEIEQLRAYTGQLKAEMEASGKVVSMQHESQLKAADARLDALKVELDHLNKTRDRDLDYFQTLTSAAAKGQIPMSDEEMAEQVAKNQADAAAAAQEKMEQERREGERDALFIGALNEIRAQVEAANSPRVVEYDDNGLIKSIGGKPVTRDESGRVRQIG